MSRPYCQYCYGTGIRYFPGPDGLMQARYCLCSAGQEAKTLAELGFCVKCRDAMPCTTCGAGL